MSVIPPLIGRKTLFNLLKLEPNESLKEIESWKVEDYRQWSLEKLFTALKGVGWPLDKSTFIAYSECVQSVQELLELLIGEEEFSEKEEDRLFLIVFELWRRLAAHEANLEIICDEIDYLITNYEDGEQVDHKIELMMTRCDRLIREQTKNEKESCLIFRAICDHCAHDFEAFLYDFISDQLEAGAYDYAEELYKRFQSYVQNFLWFEFLRMRLSDAQKASSIIEQLYKKLKKENDNELLFEILYYLTNLDNSNFSCQFFELLAEQDLSNDEVSEFISLAKNFIDKCDIQSSAKIQLSQIINNRLKKI
jgi:hypothetical protein